MTSRSRYRGVARADAEALVERAHQVALRSLRYDRLTGLAQPKLATNVERTVLAQEGYAGHHASSFGPATVAILVRPAPIRCWAAASAPPRLSAST